LNKGRFSEEQVVKMSLEATVHRVASVAKAPGISARTIYTWRKRYGGMAVDEVRRARQLEQENAD
jgi:putative transposase